MICNKCFNEPAGPDGLCRWCRTTAVAQSTWKPGTYYCNPAVVPLARQGWFERNSVMVIGVLAVLALLAHAEATTKIERPTGLKRERFAWVFSCSSPTVTVAHATTMAGASIALVSMPADTSFCCFNVGNRCERTPVALATLREVRHGR